VRANALHRWVVQVCISAFLCLGAADDILQGLRRASLLANTFDVLAALVCRHHEATGAVLRRAQGGALVRC